MRVLKIIAPIVAAMLVVGCTGQVLTKNITIEEAAKAGTQFNGVIYYPQAMFFEISKTTIRKNERGTVIGWEVEADDAKNALL